MKNTILIFLLILGLGLYSGCFSATGGLETDKKSFIKNIILKKKEIIEVLPQGRIYTQAIDTFFQNHKNNEKAIESIDTRISKIDKARSRKNRLIFEYIEYKIGFSFLLLSEKETNKEGYRLFLKLKAKDAQTYVDSLSLTQLKEITLFLYEDKKNYDIENKEAYLKEGQKARDQIRILDIQAIRSAIEQSYQYDYTYPSEKDFYKVIDSFMDKIPKDPFAGFKINKCNFGYIYEVTDSEDGTRNQNFRISTCLENKGNIFDKTSKDGGIYINRLELGTRLSEDSFKEKFYINDISHWEEYSLGEEVFDENLKKEVLYHMIFKKYITENPKYGTIHKFD